MRDRHGTPHKGAQIPESLGTAVGVQKGREPHQSHGWSLKVSGQVPGDLSVKYQACRRRLLIAF